MAVALSLDGSNFLDEIVRKVSELKDPAQIAAAVESALVHPSIFVFAELLELPAVQNLQASNPNLLELLKIFTFGTLSDLKGKNITLTDIHRTKLKKLTVINLASEKRLLSYEELQQSLEVKSVRELEDFLIDCLYQGLISGKLDHSCSTLVVESCISRDLKPHQIDEIFATLLQWSNKSEELLKAISVQIAHAQQSHEQTRAHKKKVEENAESIKLTLKLQSESHGMGLMGDHMMGLMGDHDLDDRHKKIRRKKGKPGP